MRLLRELFVSFVKIGLFTFGGGYAMLPMLQREVVDRHHWATEDEMLNYFAVGQCTPGVIAVNTATFIGVKLKGAIGGAVATFAVVLPSFLIITVISTLLKQFSSYETVRHAFAGIRIGVAALVVVSVARLFQKGVKDLLGFVLFAFSLVLVGFFDCSPIWIVLAAMAVGIVKQKKEQEKRMIYLLLFWEFFKTGLFTIGGGLATLPFLSQMGETYGWFTQEELTNMLAVSESTPGPIGVNMATYVGNTAGGVAGGALATFALVLPSYLIIYLIAKIILRFQRSPYVTSSMETLRPASVGMIAAAVLGVLQAVLLDMEAAAAKNWTGAVSGVSLLFFALLLALYGRFQKKLHPVVILALGAVIGIVCKL